jgi:hypothetical protein
MTKLWDASPPPKEATANNRGSAITASTLFMPLILSCEAGQVLRIRRILRV